MTEVLWMFELVRHRAAVVRRERGASALEFILLAVAVVGLVGVAVMFVRNKIKSEGQRL